MVDWFALGGVPLYNLNLLGRQPIQRIHQPINRPIRRLDRPLQHRVDLGVVLGRVLVMDEALTV